MKRTAKWQRTLTIKQLRHMRDNQNTLTLREFKDQRIKQKSMKAESDAAGFTYAEPCWECWEIERRLKVAGVL